MPFVLERSWVGQRVSVRRAVRHPDRDGVAFSDVVGDLVSLDADHAVVETSADLIEIPVTQVAIARLVPPSTRDELALEAVIARGWRAAETEPLGGWTLRASNGFTGRANSVLPLGPPGISMGEALEAVTQWYQERNLPPKFQVPVEGRRLLDADLGERGWIPSEDVHVMTLRLPKASRSDPVELPKASRSDPIVDVSLRPTPDEDWFGVFRAGQGASADARGVLLRHDNVGFAHVRVAREIVAVGRGTIDDEWLGITAVEVVPDARRRGFARMIMAALTEWGVQRGATRSHLEVSSTNEAALSLYRALGYRVHHDYRYRTAPG